MTHSLQLWAILLKRRNFSIRFEKIRHHKQDQIMKGDDPLQMFERRINENDEVFLVTI